MGLRERNAAQTRELILATAVELFRTQGYDATRMEEIAERADIGTTTLYRYFPTKDQLVVQPLALNGQMAEEVRSRPAEEPLDVTLGHALRALLATPRPDGERLRELLVVAGSVPSIQARLLEEFERERAMLERAIADRLGRPHDDLFCRMTARFTTAILELVGGVGRTDEPAVDNQSAAEEAMVYLRATLDQLALEPPVLPRLT